MTTKTKQAELIEYLWDRGERIQTIRDHFPAELIALDNWVVYELWTNPNKPGKTDKRPKQARNIRWGAKSNKATTWASFDAAAAAFLKHDRIHGLGFMFGESAENKSGYFGFDADECIQPVFQEAFRLAEQAERYAEALDTYTEMSLSGTGIHCIGRGELPAGGRKRGDYEIYDHGRFFTVTGDVLADFPSTANERTAEIEAIHKQIFKPDPHSDILDIARAAKNGEKFTALWDGGGHDDVSAGDMALCNMLAFYTGRNAAEMDRLFRQSGRMRGKWDEVHYSTGETYGQHTIAQAIKQTTEIYTPAQNGQQPPPPEGPAASVADLQQAASKLAKGDYAAANKIIAQAGELEPLQAEQVLHAIKAATKIALGPLREQLKAVNPHANSDSIRPENIRQVFAEHEFKFALNEVSGIPYMDGARLSDWQEAKVITTVQDEILAHRRMIQDTLLQMAGDNRFHPFRDYFTNLPSWDREPRIYPLIDLMQLADKEQRDLVIHWLCGIIDRVFTGEPNRAIAFTGEKGIGKSLWTMKIAPRVQWWTDAPLLDMKDTRMSMLEYLIWEVAESSVSPAVLKREITRRKVNERRAYGRFDIDAVPVANFILTSNSATQALKVDLDSTRRYSPIESIVKHGERMPIDWDSFDIKQFWAEVMDFYRLGTTGQLKPILAAYAEGLMKSDRTATTSAQDMCEAYLIYDELLDEALTTTEPARLSPIDIVRAFELYAGLKGNQNQNKDDVRDWLVATTGKNVGEWPRQGGGNRLRYAPCIRYSEEVLDLKDEYEARYDK